MNTRGSFSIVIRCESQYSPDYQSLRLTCIDMVKLLSASTVYQGSRGCRPVQSAPCDVAFGVSGSHELTCDRILTTLS